MTRRMIETTFPIIEISQLAIPERSSYKPIYQMSKWFARRSSSIFRAILLSCILDPSDDIMKEFYEVKDNFNNITILDPFMGGGTTIIEALRLGMNCIGVDINPVAWFITKTESVMVDTEELNLLITKCEGDLKNHIKKWYKTFCPECKNNADIIYTHWVKSLPCPTCNSNIPMFRNFLVGYLANEAIVYCPSCHAVFSSNKPLTSEISCPDCNNKFKTSSGYRKGRKILECPDCGDLIKILNTTQSRKAPLSSKPFAIEGFCSHCANDSDPNSDLSKSKFKFIKKVSQEDLNLYEEAEEQWQNLSDQYLWPKEDISIGVTTKVLLNHNYSKWADLFNSRQLLTLSLILDYIKDIEEDNLQEMLLAAFLNLLNHNNTFTRYSPKGQKVEGIFSRHDFHPLSTYAENNVWGTRYGRGTWIKCLKRLLKGKEYNHTPYNFEYSSKDASTRKRHKVMVGKIDGRIHNGEIEDFPNQKSNLLLLCQDSEKIPLFPNGIDLIISDPPYADNVNYSELSDFLYVWIRLILKKKYPIFVPVETPKLEEAIEAKNRNTDYYLKLANIFSNCKRQLSPDGVFVFTFHHADPDTWFKLADLIEQSGFSVKKTHALQSEALNVLNIQNKKAVSYDLIISCYLTVEEIRNNVSLAEFVIRLNKNYHNKIEYYSNIGLTIQTNNVIVVFFGEYLELISQVQPILEEKPIPKSDLWKSCKDLYLSIIQT
ncbi:MAG: DNA methyltransferase [Candidatus Hodarchaeales archaeon]